MISISYQGYGARVTAGVGLVGVDDDLGYLKVCAYIFASNKYQSII